MRSSFIPILLVLFGTMTSRAAEVLPAQYLDKVDGTPDFCQLDHRFGKFPGNGTEICAPVALSNALVWLNHNGYPKLLHKTNPSTLDQADLIRTLCKAEFLSPDEQIGTPPKRVITGIEAYLKHAGYACKIEQMGWRSSLHSLGKVPDADWMLKSCLGHSSVLINVGWYKVHQNTYQRLGGHWVTMVGFKQDQGHRVILIHDPAQHGGNEKKTEPCKLAPLSESFSLETQKGELIGAHGYYQLDGIHVGRRTDLAIIDGVVAFLPFDLSR